MRPCSMRLERVRRVVSLPAALVGALVRFLPQMVLQNVSLQCLVFAEALYAGRVVAALVSLLAFMDQSVPLESLAGREALSALRAVELGFLGVCGENVAVEVLFIGIGFVAPFVGTLVWPLVVM